MKKHATLIVSIISLFLSPSCGKKSSHTQTCQIVTIQDGNGSSTTTYTITYNNQGKISTEQYTQGGTAYSKVFTYNGNTEIMTTSANGGSAVDSMIINSNGLIESDYFSYPGTDALTTYTYSGTELQKAVQVVNGGVPLTTTYTWSGGDVVGSSDGVNSVSFTYNSKGSVAGDYWSIIQLVNYGAYFVKSAHQLAAYQAGSNLENISYSYDGSGKITGVTGTVGSSVETISYEYACN